MNSMYEEYLLTSLSRSSSALPDLLVFSTNSAAFGKDATKGWVLEFGNVLLLLFDDRAS